MIGLVITNYERPQYLKRMLASLRCTQFPRPTVIALVDDGSRKPQTLKLLTELRLPGVPVYKILRPRVDEFGVHDCLRIGWEFLLRECKCSILANLDSDAIVTPDWLGRLEKLYLEHRRGGPLAVTGFNTLNHPVLAWHQDYCVKESIGGINVFFDVAFYHEMVAQTLTAYGWDWALVRAMQARGYPMLCCRPSVVQHIGLQGFHSNGKQTDVACDFPGKPRWSWGRGLFSS